MDKKLIDLVINCLPEKLLSDGIFLEFKKEFIDVFDKVKLIGKIILSEEIYETFMVNNLQYEDRVLKDNSLRLLRLSFFRGKGYILDIYRYEENFIIILKISEPNIYREITLNINPKFKVGTLVTEKRNDNFCEDFKCDICYYNNEGDLLNVDSQEEIDYVFSKRFSVPISMARFLRNNFQKFKDKINVFYAKELMASKDNELREEDLLLFKGPFNLKDLKEYVINCVREDIISVLSKNNMDFEEYLNTKKIKNEDIIDKITYNLLSQIGEGEVVISNNIIDNLISVLEGFALGFVNTRGYIIKKLNDYFIFYYVCIENDMVTLMSQEISREDAKILFNKGNNSIDNNSLVNFFGIANGRK